MTVVYRHSKQGPLAQEPRLAGFQRYKEARADLTALDLRAEFHARRAWLGAIIPVVFQGARAPLRPRRLV